VAPYDAKEKNRNIGAQLQSIPYTNPKNKILENLLPMWLLVRTNLYIPSRFWTTDAKFNTYQRYEATCGKNLYRCTSTVTALNYCSRIFLKTLSYLYEVVRTIFSADFLDFRNFWPQFRENCGAT